MTSENKAPQGADSNLAPASDPAIEVEVEDIDGGRDASSNDRAEGAPARGPASPGRDASSEDVEQRIEALEKDRQDTFDRLLRTAADFENFRKRSRRDQDDARVKGREDVLREMLPVVDNLERALAAARQGPSDSGSLVQGVELVLKQFLNALEKLDVVSFDARGQGFDPTRHEAISQMETEESPAGTVVAEMQRGFMIGARLLRPALVVVARPTAAAVALEVESHVGATSPEAAANVDGGNGAADAEHEPDPETEE